MEKVRSVRVLLIDGSLFTIKHVRRMLKEAGSPQFKAEAHYVDRLAAGLDYLAKNKTDVILLTPALPDSKELESLMKVYDRAPDVPVIVLTGLEDETLAM